MLRLSVYNIHTYTYEPIISMYNAIFWELTSKSSIRLMRLRGNQQTVNTNNMVSRIKLRYLARVYNFNDKDISPVGGFDSLSLL